jgi:hypothetical protein
MAVPHIPVGMKYLNQKPAAMVLIKLNPLAAKHIKKTM